MFVAIHAVPFPASEFPTEALIQRALIASGVTCTLAMEGADPTTVIRLPDGNVFRNKTFESPFGAWAYAIEHHQEYEALPVERSDQYSQVMDSLWTISEAELDCNGASPFLRGCRSTLRFPARPGSTQGEESRRRMPP